MRHEPWHLVAKHDATSDFSYGRPNADDQEHQRSGPRCARRELRELPISNPAELAGYAADADPTGESDDEQSFVDLGFADQQAHATEGDTFGSFGAEDDIELDAT